MVKPKPLEEKIKLFWSKVDKSPGLGPNGDCWEWRGPLTKDNYGVFSHQKRTLKIQRAHRFSYYIQNGLFDLSLHICHKCDNRKCVNPKHLWLGTNMDNSRDKVNKQRQHSYSRRRLTEKLVINLRKSYPYFRVDVIDLARNLGLNHETLCSALRGKSYKHLPFAILKLDSRRSKYKFKGNGLFGDTIPLVL